VGADWLHLTPTLQASAPYARNESIIIQSIDSISISISINISMSIDDRLQRVRTELQRMRQQRDQHHAEFEAEFQSPDAAAPTMLSPPLSSPQRRMRSILRTMRSDTIGSGTTQLPDTQVPDTQVPYTQVPNTQVPDMMPTNPAPRPTAQPSERFLRRRQRREGRLGPGRIDSLNDHLAELQDAGERLAQVNEDLRILLERPIGDEGPQSATETAIEGDIPHERQGRRKRRRLDRQNLRREYPNFKYGHYGQVVPGKLKMQLVSSDGGILGHPTDRTFSNDALFGAQNALRDDHTVYCTKSQSCNMVLSHQGETTFCLEKLVIMAPMDGFTDP